MIKATLFLPDGEKLTLSMSTLLMPRTGEGISLPNLPQYETLLVREVGHRFVQNESGIAIQEVSIFLNREN